MQVLPRGGVGELVVEGPLVGRGYHGRPDLTQNVFLEWPEKSSWAYRTGDLVRELSFDFPKVNLFAYYAARYVARFHDRDSGTHRHANQASRR